MCIWNLNTQITKFTFGVIIYIEILAKMHLNFILLNKPLMKLHTVYYGAFWLQFVCVLIKGLQNNCRKQLDKKLNNKIGWKNQT